jgi:hypothetical protein
MRSRKIMKFKITPKTDIIAAWRNTTGMKLSYAMKELIDNSFDAGATAIVITLDNANQPIKITVTDNGAGCGDKEAFFTAGAHLAGLNERQLGRYGVGLVFSSIWLGQELEVRSRTKSTNIHGAANWEEIRLGDDWTADDVAIGNGNQVEPPRPTIGTDVIISEVFQHRIKGWNTLKAILSYTFRPALISKRAIIINGVSLDPSPLPGLLDVLNLEGEYLGRRWTMRAGRLAETAKNNWGFDVAYGHRLISSE